jgi:hypothetical protein
MQSKKPTLLDNLHLIGPSLSFTLAILKGLKSKVEYVNKVQNRIGKFFPEGLRGVMAIGPPQCGKSHTMRAIFEGMQLSTANPDTGKPRGVYIPAGSGTSRGKFDVLRNHSSAVIFIDELDIESPQDIKLFKQITGGGLTWLRYDDTMASDFEALVICATNGLPLSTKNSDHLEAMTDRFSIVKFNNKFNPVEMHQYVTEEILHKKEEPIDWYLIVEQLMEDKYKDLDKEHTEQIKNHWLNKADECIEERTLIRQCHDFYDCYRFVLRFFGSLDGELFDIATQLANESVCTNKVHLVHFSALEKMIYERLSQDDFVSLDDIKSYCAKKGVNDGRLVNAAVRRMMVNRLINALTEGFYTIKRTERLRKEYVEQNKATNLPPEFLRM